MASDRLFSDGVLVVNKPVGPTSHDIVAVMRRVIRRSTTEDEGSTMKVGHTGTLDPLASGVLPLVLGKATRLAQFLSSSEKEYEADIELGVSTTTLDRAGAIVERPQRRAISDLTEATIADAVSEFRGTYLQQPPVYSAKKVDGDRAYDLARRNVSVRLDAVEVTASTVEVLEYRDTRLRIRLVCSAGYYVRSLAEALGDRLGTGAHLAALVRTRSGDFTLTQAVGLDVLDHNPAAAAAGLVRMADLLPALPVVTLTAEGASLAARGGFIGRSHIEADQLIPTSGRSKLLHPDGHLVALAQPGVGGYTGFLHPNVVLE